jgi:hypothetical protein
MLVQYTNRRQSSSGGCDRAMDPPSPMSGRKISMLRLLTKCACGCIVGRARRSHTRWSIPNRDSSAERVRPVGPAPTMSTGTETSAGDEASSARDDEVDARVDADTSYGQLGRGAGEPSRGLVRGRDPRCARDRTSRLIDPASPRAPYCVRRYVCVTTRFSVYFNMTAEILYREAEHGDYAVHRLVFPPHRPAAVRLRVPVAAAGGVQTRARALHDHARHHVLEWLPE